MPAMEQFRPGPFAGRAAADASVRVTAGSVWRALMMLRQVAAIAG